MHIQAVITIKDMKSFIHLPFQIDKNDPIWVEPLWREERAQFNPKTNPLLEHTDYRLFLLMEGVKIIGRIAAFIDTLAMEYWNDKSGLFDYYECPENPEASKRLLSSAAEWLRTKGMTSMRGLPQINQYRMFALGVVPEYHGKGIESPIYRALYESCYSADLRMEIN